MRDMSYFTKYQPRVAHLMRDMSYLTLSLLSKVPYHEGQVLFHLVSLVESPSWDKSSLANPMRDISYFTGTSLISPRQVLFHYTDETSVALCIIHSILTEFCKSLTIEVDC